MNYLGIILAKELRPSAAPAPAPDDDKNINNVTQRGIYTTNVQKQYFSNVGLVIVPVNHNDSKIVKAIKSHTKT